MKTFTVKDLRERTDELIHGAEEGKIALVTNHGTPVFIALPFDDVLLLEGVSAAMAIRLFEQAQFSLSSAAHLAKCSEGEMIDLLGKYGVAVVGTKPEELERKLDDFR